MIYGGKLRASADRMEQNESDVRRPTAHSPRSCSGQGFRRSSPHVAGVVGLEGARGWGLIPPFCAAAGWAADTGAAGREGDGGHQAAELSAGSALPFACVSHRLSSLLAALFIATLQAASETIDGSGAAAKPAESAGEWGGGWQRAENGEWIDGGVPVGPESGPSVLSPLEKLGLDRRKLEALGGATAGREAVRTPLPASQQESKRRARRQRKRRGGERVAAPDGRVAPRVAPWVAP